MSPGHPREPSRSGVLTRRWNRSGSLRRIDFASSLAITDQDESSNHIRFAGHVLAISFSTPFASTLVNLEHIGLIGSRAFASLIEATRLSTVLNSIRSVRLRHLRSRRRQTRVEPAGVAQVPAGSSTSSSVPTATRDSGGRRGTRICANTRRPREIAATAEAEAILLTRSTVEMVAARWGAQRRHVCPLRDRGPRVRLAPPRPPCCQRRGLRANRWPIGPGALASPCASACAR